VGHVTSNGKVGLDIVGLIKTVPFEGGSPSAEGACAEEQLRSRKASGCSGEGGLRSWLHGAWAIAPLVSL